MGAQWPLKDPPDLNAYTQFFVDELKTRNMAWVYYCGSSFNGDPPFSDHRDWSIFRFKTRSWHKDLASILTGAARPSPTRRRRRRGVIDIAPSCNRTQFLRLPPWDPVAMTKAADPVNRNLI